MLRRTTEPLRGWFFFSDLAVTCVAWILADFLRLRSGLVPIFAPDYPPFELCIRQLPFIALLSVIAYRSSRMYDVSRMLRFRQEILAVLHGTTLLALMSVALIFVIQTPYRPRGVLVLFPLLTAAGLLAVRRLSWRTLGRLRTQGYNQTHALIVGSGRLARHTAEALHDAAWMGIHPVAFVDDRPPAHPIELAVLNPISSLPQLVEEHHIEHVFIALPMNRYAEVRKAFDALSQSVVEVRLVADAPAMSSLSLTTSYMQGLPIIGLRESEFYGINNFVKRVMDVTLSIIAIVALSPLLGMIAVLVKATSRGPVFYRQERCSLNGQTFQMLKYRTMTVDAETASGPVMTKQNDPRVTQLGRFLRESNLDELPQLFNVLLGEMSLVGPRPERPVFVNQFKKTIPNYMARHAVKCGMTGWAQVNGWRGNSSLRRRVQFDLFYITHWNPLFDLRIMVLTVLTMLFKKQKHAY